MDFLPRYAYRFSFSSISNQANYTRYADGSISFPFVNQRKLYYLSAPKKMLFRRALNAPSSRFCQWLKVNLYISAGIPSAPYTAYSSFFHHKKHTRYLGNNVHAMRSMCSALNKRGSPEPRFSWWQVYNRSLTDSNSLRWLCLGQGEPKPMSTQALVVHYSRPRRLSLINSELGSVLCHCGAFLLPSV